ncbi:SUKH-3 domain-containing protein [Streptomyces longispororuber]|uniref:SUKH-3 domain-containing protein n=1 Tax=Streptomyces longispororuber TaxID=68230 RepID=UPI0036F66CCD
MDVGDLSREVREWLERNGWFLGRDIGEARAGELIDVRVSDAERQGSSLVPVDAAIRVIRAYGLLTLEHPRVGDFALNMKPTVGYDGDAALIAELATNLGLQLFPVGYETSEEGLILVDEIGRFFLLHHTGAYFWGANEQDAFARFLSGADALDAEDFFV